MSEEIQNQNEIIEVKEESISTNEKQEVMQHPEKKKKTTLEELEKEILSKQNNLDKFPSFSPGDIIRVNVKIIEGEKQRIQPYEGTVIAIKHGNHRKTFTVRRVSYGVAIERIFPFHSPIIDSIQLIRKGKTRRSKLYFLREKYGKSAVLREKV